MKNMASIGFSKYSITEEGRIYSHKSNRFLNPYKSIDKAGGYFVHSLWNDDTKQKLVKLHRLVAIMYIPNPENKEQVNHKDGNKLNNSLDNLEWATDSENVSHAYSIGLNNKKNKFLNEKDLKIYLDLFFEGNNLTKLASISNLKLSQFSIRLKKFAKENNLLDEYLNELKQQKIKRQSKV